MMRNNKIERSSKGGAWRLLAENLDSPCDVDVNKPLRMTWRTLSNLQTAYQVTVWIIGGKCVYDSGRIESHATECLIPAHVLPVSERFHWTVASWNGEQVFPVSSAEFGTGPGDTWLHSSPIWVGEHFTEWTDYDIETELVQGDKTQLDVGNGLIVKGAHRTGLTFRATDLRSGYVWVIDMETGVLTAGIRKEGKISIIQKVSFEPRSPGTVHKIYIRLRGETVSTYIDHKKIFEIDDSTYSCGGVGVTGFPDARSKLKNFRVTNPEGKILLDEDYSLGNGSFNVGTVSSGYLEIAERSNGLLPIDSEWALFRTTFQTHTHHNILWASLFSTGGCAETARQFIYRLMINGIEVGMGPTLSTGSETRYDGFDVTSLLNQGNNVLSVIAWTSVDQRFQAELYIRYDDGSEQIIGTSPNWRAFSGDKVFPHVGSVGTGFYAVPEEDFQGREYPDGFQSLHFNDESWSNADKRPKFGELIPSPIGKMCVAEYWPSSINILNPCTAVLDFGRTHVGGVHFAGELDENTDVEFRFGELLDSAGHARYQLATGNVYRDRWRLNKGHVDEKTWGLRVFRYVEVIGLTSNNIAGFIRAIGHIYPIGEAGSFGSSSPSLDRVMELCRTTILSTNLNLMVDAWSREREPYEADTYLQMKAASIIGEDTALAHFTFEYLMQRRTWPTEWPFYMIFAAWDLYQRDGDESYLQNSYQGLCNKLPSQWFNKRLGLIRKTKGSDGSGSQVNYDIVDWPKSERDEYVFGPVNTVVNCLAYAAFHTMFYIAQQIGNAVDAQHFESIAQQLRYNINHLLWNDENGAYADGLDSEDKLITHYAQHASVFAVACGVADDHKSQLVADRVSRQGMLTSVYGAPFVLRSLFRGGHGEDALELITGSGLRSWMNMVNAGAGATMEAWSETLKPNISCAHPWAASPLFIVSEELMGIYPTSSRYKTFSVAPKPSGLHSAQIKVPTSSGMISVAFVSEIDRFQLEVGIPAGTSADIVMPDPSWEVRKLDESLVDPAQLCKVSQGMYTFVARPSAKNGFSNTSNTGD